MSVSISPVAGAGWQFFNNNGVPLAGGLLYTYLAGTVTPATTYTSVSGAVANSNPIVLDAAGRVSSEVWLTVGRSYKLVLKDANGVQIWSHDNVSGLNDSAAANALAASLAASSGSSLIGYMPLSGVTATTVQAALRNLEAELAPVQNLADVYAAPGGAALIGTADGSTVQASLTNRPTSAALANSTGATLIGAAGGQTVQGALTALYATQTSGVLGYATKADMDADLTPADKSVAYVLNDGTVAYNGVYRKSGASGSGSWILQSNPWALQSQPAKFTAIANNDYTVIPFAPNARYVSSTVVTGAFKIKLPVSRTGTYMSMSVRIMDQFGELELTIVGDNAPTGWAYTYAFVSLKNTINPRPKVRFGYDGTSDCIWIGETTNVWTAPQVWVRDVTLGSTGYNTGAWVGNWAITVVGSFDTVEGSPLTPEQVVPLQIPRQFAPSGAIFTGGAGDTTGAFKIQLPVRNTGSFVTMNVRIMDVYGFHDITISGANYSSWSYTSALNNGTGITNAEPSIRWGNDGTYDCIWIGDVDSSWAYPQVVVTNVQVTSAGYTNSAWLNDWLITLVTSFGTVNQGPFVPKLPLLAGQTINGGTVNFPSGTGTTVSTYLGYQAGANSVGVGQYNTFVGYQSGYANTTGYNNTFGGLQTGAANTTGYGNSGWGLQALQYLTTGAFNQAFGIHALLSLVDGVANTAIGGGSMEYLISGGSNTAIGMYAGRDVQGSGNVFIGNRSGQGQTTINNRLYIANNELTTLIYGEFDNKIVVIDGTLTTNQYILSNLNTAPASATATGTKGEIRVTAGYIYVCTATNTWVRTALSTW